MKKSKSRKFWLHFFSRSYALFELRNLAKKKYTTVFLVSATPPKSLNRISWNFVVMKDIMCRYAFLQEILIWSFWGSIYIPFFLRLPVTNAWNCHSYSILKQCWSVGYVGLLTLSFILLISGPTYTFTHGDDDIVLFCRRCTCNIQWQGCTLYILKSGSMGIEEQH